MNRCELLDLKTSCGQSFVVMLLLISAILCVKSNAAVAPTPISATAPLYTYDLSPTLKYDLMSTAGKDNLYGEAHIVSALQGLANRIAPHLYVYYMTFDPSQPGQIDHFWLDRMREMGYMTHRPLTPISSLEQLVTKFQPYYKGVVLYDLKVPATSDVASTVAGCDDLLPIAYDPTPGSVYDRLVVHGPRLPVVVRLVNPDGTSRFTGVESGSAKVDAYVWAKRNYLDTGKCNPELLAYYLDSSYLKSPMAASDPTCHQLTNHDYFISKRAFFFDLSPWDDEAPQDDPLQPIGTDYGMMTSILRTCYDQTKGAKMIRIGGFVPWPFKYTNYTGGIHEPVSTEWRYAAIISCFNAYMDADACGPAAMVNASVYCSFPLKARYPQRKPNIADWKKAGYVDASGNVVPHKYVTFYGGDFDSASWMYEKLPSMWTDSARGTIPISWGFDPNLSARFPIGFAWTRSVATPNDHFVAGDSGAGYVNLGNLDGFRPFSGLPSGLDAWSRYCQYFYNQWDITLTGFTVDGYSKFMSNATALAYSKFSPDGVGGQKFPTVQGFLPGTQTPYHVSNSDMPDPNHMDTAMQYIHANTDPETGPGPYFNSFRTVLWYPSQLTKLYSNANSIPGVVVVDMYTFMGLEKMTLMKH